MVEEKLSNEQKAELKMLVKKFIADGGKVFICDPHRHSQHVVTLAEKHRLEAEARKELRARRKRRKKDCGM
jgi:hypothetical protein